MLHRRIMIAGAILVMSACAGMPETSRTGAIHEVRFGESLNPINLRVAVGDEVRWINQRTSPITIEFLENALENVTCESGFSDLLGRIQETTTIQPNETASLCFGTPGTRSYNSRATSAVQGGRQIESGVIVVGSVASS